MIEPDRSNFELLQENVAPYPQVTPMQAALWNRNEEIDLLDPGLGKWGFMTAQTSPAGHRAGSNGHTVRAVTVDQLMREHNLTAIDILKMDIEGAEREVVMDPAVWIGRVEAFIIELHERMKPGCLRSFYAGSGGFRDEWRQGEKVYLSRGRCLQRPAYSQTGAVAS